VSFGKSKLPGLSELVEHYRKSGSQFFELEEIELKSHTESANDETTLERCRKKDQDTLLDALSRRQKKIEACILLDETGINLKSTDWPQLLQNAETVFVIGGACGLSTELKSRCSKLISFGKQTFSHQLIKPLLLEQVFRGFSVMNSHPYHRE
jgi:23S rRNA (pseudouridine1915-N3)-methyltransferase